MAAAPDAPSATAVHPPWFDPRLPAREDCVLKALLDSRAARFPDRRVALFEDGTAWTYAECRERVRRTAAALQRLGVKKGDRVAAWLPSGPTVMLAWFATNYLGAVFVPLNTAYRGRILEGVVNRSRARLMVAHADLVGRLAGLGLESLETVVAVGGAPVAPDGLRLLDAAALDGDAAALDDSATVEPWDPQTIIYTSGTTGPSKGVLSPYLQLYTTAVVSYGYLRDGEAVLVNLPMFHVGGTSATYAALVRSGSFYLVDGFSTQSFWDQVRRGNCATTSGLIGVMARFLASVPPRPDDADNPLHSLTLFPVSPETVAMAERFGFHWVTGFNMTEVSSPLITDLDTRIYGSCGRPRTGVECRLVDANDVEVPRGAVGELVVRTDLPWTLMTAYDGLPEATAQAWRNGWFHTGDLLRQDEAGNYFFVDRLKDTIRRRGENVSSLEVEAEVRAFPAVAEAVAIGVPAPGGEQDVLVAVVPKPGATLEPKALFEFLVPRLPYFAVPRYVRLVAEIPKTETNKLRKTELRAEAVTPDTWDREAAGIVLKRERLGK